MDYPSNSKTTRPDTPPEPKKIEKVTVNEVKRRKKSIFRRSKEAMTSPDAQGIAGFVFSTVIIPAIKDLISDATTQGIDRALFGDSARSPRRRGSGNSYVNYSGYSGLGKNTSGRRDERRDLSPRSRSRHDFDELILGSRGEATEVLDRMYDLLERYELVTVGDFYDLVGAKREYTDTKWGWRTLQGSSVRPTREGFILDLPRPEALD